MGCAQSLVSDQHRADCAGMGGAHTAHPAIQHVFAGVDAWVHCVSMACVRQLPKSVALAPARTPMQGM